MNFNDYIFDETFTVHGIFTLNKKDLPGGINCNLIHKPGEITLQTFGLLTDNEKKSSFMLFEELEQTKIYGMDDNANIIILDVDETPYGNVNFPGFPIMYYRVKEYKVFNIYYNEADINIRDKKSLEILIEELENNIEIEYLIFNYDYLKEWIGKDVSYMKVDKNNQETSFGVKLSEYKPTIVNIEKFEMKLKDAISTSNDFKELQIKQNYYLKLFNNENQKIELEKAIFLSKKIKQFIEMLVDFPLNFTNINFVYKYKTVDNIGEIPLIRGKVLFPQTILNKTYKNQQFENKRLSEIEENFSKAINNWISMQDKLYFIVNQHLSNLYKNTYLENKLVDVIRNLEVFHRTFIETDGKVKLSDSEKFKNELILSKIEEVLKEEEDLKYYRKKLNREWKNISLKERLMCLFEELPLDKKQIIFSEDEDIETFANRLKDTRNYYTHGDKKNKNVIRDVNEMYTAYNKCKVILNYYILKQLEIKK
ncbi:HEPN domain-containing protein [Macrococcus capreoli]|uniref:HEPN domain-containing protein n=1 Tax=Macrococcus capreoli TaxID=2982690 RepID=UPI003F41FA2C